MRFVVAKLLALALFARDAGARDDVIHHARPLAMDLDHLPTRVDQLDASDGAVIAQAARWAARQELR